MDKINNHANKFSRVPVKKPKNGNFALEITILKLLKI